MKQGTALTFVLLPVYGLSVGGADGFATGILIAAVLYAAVTGMTSGRRRAAFTGWCIGVFGLAGVSYGGGWSEGGFTGGLVGVCVAYALVFLLAQAEWYLHEFREL